jgi:hypothetical protein
LHGKQNYPYRAACHATFQPGNILFVLEKRYIIEMVSIKSDWTFWLFLIQSFMILVYERESNIARSPITRIKAKAKLFKSIGER